jgi:hypothetical protein
MTIASLNVAEHIYSVYSLQKDARNLYRTLKRAWRLFRDLLDIPLLLASGIERALPLVAFVSALLITVVLPIMAAARTGRTCIKPGWRFAR